MGEKLTGVGNPIDGRVNREREGSSRLALVFPGQGSQKVGMGLELYKISPAARAIFQEADDVLRARISDICFNGPEDILKQTINTQPAIFTTSVAALEALKESNNGKIPGVESVAGHSIGQYAALVASGAIKFKDAAVLVRTRGELMHHAGKINEGSMVSILGLDMPTVEELCQLSGAEIAVDNSEGQIVISGSKMALVNAVNFAQGRGAKRTIALDVGGAFHSSLMAPALGGMREALSVVKFNDPEIPVISNVTGEPIVRGEDLRKELYDQICKPVLWKRSVERMAEGGINTFIEVGSGNVLSGLMKRIVKGTFSVFNADSPEAVKRISGIISSPINPQSA